MPELDDRIEFRVPKPSKKKWKAAALLHGFDETAPWARKRLDAAADHDIANPPTK